MMNSDKKVISIRRRDIMRDAHQVAKVIVNNVGNYQIAMSFALKFVYAYRADQKAAHDARRAGKRYVRKYVRDVVKSAFRHFEPKMVAGVPVWAIYKDFPSYAAGDIVWFTTETKKVSETEKAVQIEFTTENPQMHGLVDSHITWVAKSIMAA